MKRLSALALAFVVMVGAGCSSSSAKPTPSPTPLSPTTTQICSMANVLLVMRPYIDEISGGVAADDPGLVLTGAMGLPQDQNDLLTVPEGDTAAAKALSQRYSTASIQLFALSQHAKLWHLAWMQGPPGQSLLSELTAAVPTATAALDNLQQQADAVGCPAPLPSAPRPGPPSSQRLGSPRSPATNFPARASRLSI